MAAPFESSGGASLVLDEPTSTHPRHEPRRPVVAAHRRQSVERLLPRCGQIAAHLNATCVAARRLAHVPVECSAEGARRAVTDAFGNLAL